MPFKKGHKTWNKGFDHLAGEKRLRVAQATKQWIKKKGHPKGMLGKHHTEETKRKQSLWHPNPEQLVKMAHHKEDHGRWTGERKRIICKFCKKEFQIPPNDIQIYCSRQCKYDFWKGPNHKPKDHKKHNDRRKKLVLVSEEHYTPEEWENLKIQYNFTCPCCKRREPEIKLTVDHIVPLKRGGKDAIDNIQPLCKSCNSKKHLRIIKYIYDKEKLCR